MSTKIQLLNIGITFLVTVRDQDGNIVDLSAASLKNIILVKPDRTKMTKTADFYTDGSDGKIKYVSVANDLDVIGIWRIQAYVEVGAKKLYTDISSFKVHDNL